MLLYFFEDMIPVLLIVVIYQNKQHQESILLHHLPHCVNDGFYAAPHPYAQLIGAKDVSCLFSQLPAYTLGR